MNSPMQKVLGLKCLNWVFSWRAAKTSGSARWGSRICPFTSSRASSSPAWYRSLALMLEKRKELRLQMVTAGKAKLPTTTWSTLVTCWYEK
ncbi:hypothetical protein FKM82_024257 [Ascaphus truei]